jgi:ribosomal-protein-alanine N-acetyltransferase
VLEIEASSFASEAWHRDMFLEFFEKQPDLFIVAKMRRRIAGYAIACVTGDRAELVSIASDPLYREQGVATAMMEYLTRELRSRKVRNWYLMVRIGNEAAIRFYRRFGFVRVRTQRDYYEDGTDAWRMRRRL